MPFVHSSLDGTLLHYVDYVPASSPPPFQPSEKRGSPSKAPSIALIFIYRWPKSHQMYEHLMLPLCETHGVRCLASDRRGFGKSERNNSESETIITYDTFAQDTIDVIEKAQVGRFIFVASSMGCGETVLAYLRMTATLRRQCLGFVWLGPSLPYPLQTQTNPLAPAREVWDMILRCLRDERAGFTRTAMPGVFGVGGGVEVSESTLQRLEWMVAQVERCVQIITSRDFTGDLEHKSNVIVGDDVGVLVIHGDSDQSMPAEASAKLIPHLVKQARVKIYEKAAHGLYLTHTDQVVEDILEFIRIRE